MGFLSGIFGSGSEWDGAAYVDKISGNKFWHQNFIDKDEMRRFGISIAMEDDPLNSSPRAPQSPKTIVGELIYLFDACLDKEDEAGAKAVARSIKHLLDNHKSRLPQYSDMRLMSIGYADYL